MVGTYFPFCNIHFLSNNISLLTTLQVVSLWKKIENLGERLEKTF